jgi:uncharacterized protein YggE
MPLMAMKMADAGQTPVESGELKVRIDITGMFELAH